MVAQRVLVLLPEFSMSVVGLQDCGLRRYETHVGLAAEESLD